MKRARGRPGMGQPGAILVGGRPIDSDAVGEMTRALRREAIYAQWDTLAVKHRATLPTIEDIGAHLHDPRWDGWAARIEVKRLADAPRTSDRRWRTTIRVAMPGWSANLYAVYVDSDHGLATGRATDARKAKADELAAIAEELRAGGLTIEQTATEIGRLDPERGEPHPTTIARYRRRKRADPSIS